MIETLTVTNMAVVGYLDIIGIFFKCNLH